MDDIRAVSALALDDEQCEITCCDAKAAATEYSVQVQRQYHLRMVTGQYSRSVNFSICQKGRLYCHQSLNRRINPILRYTTDWYPLELSKKKDGINNQMISDSKTPSRSETQCSKYHGRRRCRKGNSNMVASKQIDGSSLCETAKINSI